MIFALLTFLAAFAIEGIGTVVSVIGLSALFGANPIIIALAVALDVGKIVVVTLLYKHWKALGITMRSYGLVAAFVTMVITSAGAAGYLSGEFQKAVMGVQEGSLKVDVLKGQIAKYEERKKQIDNQIAAIPEKYSANQKIRLMNQFKQEQKDLQDKIAAIDKELPALQITQIGVEAKAGPILYISKAFNVTIEEAVKWVILLIIVVFDPLAVFLIVAGNFLWDQHTKERKKKRKDEQLDAELAKFNAAEHGGEFPHPVRTVAPETLDRIREEIRQVPVPRLTDQEFEDRSASVKAATEKYGDFRLEQDQKGWEDTQPLDPLPQIEEPNVQEPEPVVLAADVPSPVADPVDQHPGPDSDDPILEELPPLTVKELNTVTDSLKPREQITLSTLGLDRPESSLTSVRPDPKTTVNEPFGEIGIGTGVYKT